MATLVYLYSPTNILSSFIYEAYSSYIISPINISTDDKDPFKDEAQYQNFFTSSAIPLL